jgi:hypothetical protein
MDHGQDLRIAVDEGLRGGWIKVHEASRGEAFGEASTPPNGPHLARPTPLLGISSNVGDRCQACGNL